MKKNRSLTGRQKLEIVIEGMRSEASVADVCRRHGISTTLFYHWRDQLMGSAEEIFKRKSNRENREEERRQADMDRLKNVIAEITAENIELKKWPMRFRKKKEENILTLNQLCHTQK